MSILTVYISIFRSVVITGWGHIQMSYLVIIIINIYHCQFCFIVYIILFMLDVLNHISPNHIFVLVFFTFCYIHTYDNSNV